MFNMASVFRLLGGLFHEDVSWFFRLFTSAEETFSHCKSEHQFNIDNMVCKHGEYFLEQRKF